MPTPERERQLARRAKFTGSKSASTVEDKSKVISLKQIREAKVENQAASGTTRENPEMVGDISLNVEDTLDMFDEPASQNNSGDRVPRDMREKLQNKKGK